ncbi:MAG: hypothetical protein M1840_008491 [Geoglossum simile]|nr:MAG: hypothetical protein M1840_008491 [Geoglossum simile]
MASSAGLRCQNSARDKSKAVPDLSGPALRNNTSHLVVCGLMEYKTDPWLFGDFLGFVDALKKADPPVHGEFINCFLLEAYFDFSGQQDIKFGHRKEADGAGWDSGDEIAIYTKVRTARQGDIVTIILIGHGNEHGIRIGGIPLSASELATACANFVPDVQVNIIIKACSSGALAKAFRVSGQCNRYVHTFSKDKDERSYSDRRSITGRIRNSLFGSSFVETLGLMRDEEELWILGKQKLKLEEDLSGPLIPMSKRSHPKVFSDSPMKKMILDIMYQYYIDLSFDCAPVRARRVLTPPNEALRIERQQRSHPPLPLSSYAATEVVLRREMEAIDTDWPDAADMGILSELLSLDRFPGPRKHRAIEGSVRALSYRFRF